MSTFRVRMINANWLKVTWRDMQLVADEECELHELLEDFSEVPGVKVEALQRQQTVLEEITVDVPRTVRGASIYKRFCALVLALEGPDIDAAFPTPVPVRNDDVVIAQPLFAHQQAAVEFLLRGGGGLLADDMGLGKGLRVDQPVLTPTGWVPIGDLKPGDFVVDPAGGFAPIRAVHHRGVLPMFAVAFTDGTGVITDAEHLWQVQSPNHRRRGTHAVMSTQELLADGLTRTVARGDRQHRWFLPDHAPAAVHESYTELPIPAYVLGVLLGDGYLPRATIANPSAEVFEAVRAYVPEIRVQQDTRCPTYSLGARIRAELAKLGLGDARSHTKYIPVEYSATRLTESDRRALLAGLLDTDGTVSRCGRVVTYSSASDRLAGDVATLARSLGGVASVYRKDITRYRYREEVRFGRPTYTVNLRMPFNPFRARAHRRELWRPQLLARAFESIEPLPPAESVCIEVASRDNLFFTKDYIPTHNTRSAGAAAAYMRGTGRILVIAPKYVRAVWRNELKALGIIAGDEEFVAIEGRSIPAGFWDRARRAKVWFVQPDLTNDWMPRLLTNAAGRPSVVVVDEAHWFRNRKSARGDALLKSLATIPKRVLLTGTPVANRPRELWSLLTMLHGTHSWGSEFAWRLRYCGAVKGAYGLMDGEPTHSDELRERLATCFLRRTADDAGLNLPPIVRSLHEVEISGGFQHKSATREELAALVTALRRSSFGTDTLAVMARLSRETSVAKLSSTVEVLAELLDANEAAVVFCHERARADELVAACPRGRAVAVHGAFAQEDRDQIVSAFQAGNGPQIICATYGALREGVTLHRARHVILHDLTWVPGDILQAEKRVHRIGQARTTFSRWMACASSFDTLLAAHLNRKARAIATSIGDTKAQEAFESAGLAGFEAESFDREVERFLRFAEV